MLSWYWSHFDIIWRKSSINFSPFKSTMHILVLASLVDFSNADSGHLTRCNFMLSLPAFQAVAIWSRNHELHWREKHESFRVRGQFSFYFFLILCYLFLQSCTLIERILRIQSQGGIVKAQISLSCLLDRKWIWYKCNINIIRLFPANGHVDTK